MFSIRYLTHVIYSRNYWSVL